MENIEGLIIGIVFFASVVLSFYFYLKARHTERMALIEKGLFHMEKKPVKKKTGLIGLKIGLFLIGIGLGLLSGFAMHSYTIIEEEICYFSMILLFGGLSLVVNNFIESKLNKLEN
jgi:predicted transporter